MKSIALVCPSGALPSSVGAALDTFELINRYVQRRSRSAEDVPPPTNVNLVSTGSAAPAIGILQPVHYGTLDDGVDYDGVFVANFDAPEGAPIDLIRQQAPHLPDWLARHGERGAQIAGSGMATIFLAEAGLLNERMAAVPWWLARRFAAAYPHVSATSDEPVVQDGDILTGDGIDADFPLALLLASRIMSTFVGSWLAERSGRRGEVRSMLRLAGPDASAFDDPLVARAQNWIHEHFAQQFTMGQLADDLNVTQAQLTRRFRKALGETPHGYLRRLRVRVGEQMLLRTDRSIERIARLVGYGDPRYFRTLFQAVIGQSPGRYRKQSRGVSVPGNS